MVNYMCNFEVYGKVQGVFFRKHTCKTARSLGLRGWCMNTENNTVKGQLEGSDQKIKQMKEWLTKTGSPKCRIDKTEFTELIEISKAQFKDFLIIKK